MRRRSANRVTHALRYPRVPRPRAVQTGDTLVVATHVSSDQRRAGQLARLAELATASTSPVVLLGDFNCDSATVSAALGPGYTLAVLRRTPRPPGRTARASRPGRSTTSSSVAVVRAAHRPRTSAAFRTTTCCVQM